LEKLEEAKMRSRKDGTRTKFQECESIPGVARMLEHGKKKKAVELENRCIWFTCHGL
jgi:hypothetical protein